MKKVNKNKIHSFQQSSYFRDMSNPNVEYLGVMAWAAQFQWIQDKIAPGDRVQIQCSANKIRVGDEVRLYDYQNFYNERLG